jgi:hypothetical protein
VDPVIVSTLITQQLMRVVAKAGWDAVLRRYYLSRRWGELPSEPPTANLEAYVDQVSRDPQQAAQVLALMSETADRLDQTPTDAEPELLESLIELQVPDELSVPPELRHAYERTLARAYPWADSDTLEMGALYCALRDMQADDDGGGEDTLLREDAERMNRLMGEPGMEIPVALSIQ